MATERFDHRHSSSRAHGTHVSLRHLHFSQRWRLHTPCLPFASHASDKRRSSVAACVWEECASLKSECVACVVEQWWCGLSRAVFCGVVSHRFDGSWRSWVSVKVRRPINRQEKHKLRGDGAPLNVVVTEPLCCPCGGQTPPSPRGDSFPPSPMHTHLGVVAGVPAACLRN